MRRQPSLTTTNSSSLAVKRYSASSQKQRRSFEHSEGSVGVWRSTDLLIRKYVANREKDRRFARAAIRHGMVEREILFGRLKQTDLEPERREHLSSLVALDFGKAIREGSLL